MSDSREGAKAGNRRWLVESRNEIQTLLLALLEREPENVTRAGRWQEALGAAFSLWRAVFLILPEQSPRAIGSAQADAVMFLKKVIDVNAIGFPDDERWSTWTCGYYLNNARYRLKDLGVKNLPRVPGADARKLWTRFCLSLRDVVDQMPVRPPQTRSPRRV